MATREQDTLKRIRACESRRDNIEQDNKRHNQIKFELVHAENKVDILRGELSREENLLRLALQVARDAAEGTLPLGRGGKSPPYFRRRNCCKKLNCTA